MSDWGVGGVINGKQSIQAQTVNFPVNVLSGYYAVIKALDLVTGLITNVVVQWHAPFRKRRDSQQNGTGHAEGDADLCLPEYGAEPEATQCQRRK